MRISDWSSDVCSSDLLLVDLKLIAPVLLGPQVIVALILIAVVEERARQKIIEAELEHPPPDLERRIEIGRRRPGERQRSLRPEKTARQAVRPGLRDRRMQIGRASCRERVCRYV